MTNRTSTARSGVGALWDKIKSFLKNEPAILLSIAGSGVSLAASLGLTANPTQTKAIYGFVATVTAVLIRQSVTPTSRVGSRLDALEAALQALQTPSVSPSPTPQSPPTVATADPWWSPTATQASPPTP